MCMCAGPVHRFLAENIVASAKTYGSIRISYSRVRDRESLCFSRGRHFGEGQVDSGTQIVMPRTPGGLEPLAAVCRSECAAPIVAALERGVRRVTDAIAEFRMECLSEGEWSKHDPESRVLRN